MADSFDYKGGAAKLQRCAGVLMGLPKSVSLGGAMGRAAMIQQLTSSSKVWDAEIGDPSPLGYSDKAILDASGVIIDAHHQGIGMAGQHSAIALELLGYLEVLGGEKGRIGRATITDSGQQRKTYSFQTGKGGGDTPTVTDGQESKSYHFQLPTSRRLN